MDRQGGVDHRRRLLAGLTGRVIEVGAGNGLNFAHYPVGAGNLGGLFLLTGKMMR